MQRAIKSSLPCVLLVFTFTAILSAAGVASISHGASSATNDQLGTTIPGIHDDSKVSQVVCSMESCSALGGGCLALTLLASALSFLLGRYSASGSLSISFDGAVDGLSNAAAQLLVRMSTAALSLASVLRDFKAAAALPTVNALQPVQKEQSPASSKAGSSQSVGSDGTDDFTSHSNGDQIGTRADSYISNSNSTVSSGDATTPENTTAGSNSTTGNRLVSTYSNITTGWSCIFSKTAVGGSSTTTSSLASERRDHISLGLLLGAGAFGKVYQGTWRGGKVAVKVITQLGSAAAQEVRREVELMLKVKHPNVVQSHHVVIWQRISPSSIMGSNSSSSNISSGSGFGRLVNCCSGGSTSSSRGPEPFIERVDSNAAATAGAHGRLSITGSVASDVAAHTSASSSVAAAAAQCWPVNSSGENCDLDNEQDDDNDGIVETQTWIVQELCNGGTLDDAARDGDLEDSLAQISCLLDISRGMQYLHNNNIMHGDLKCANVCLMKVPRDPALPISSSGSNSSAGGGDGVKYSCKVADFSLTRTIDAGKDHHSTKSLGTVTHLAPELLANGRQTPACDVYSFGMMIWELLHKKSPFNKCMHEVEVLEKIIVKQERPAWDQDRAAAGLTDHNPDLIRLAEQCWDQDPSKRPTFAQVCARLEEMQQGLTAAVAAAAAAADDDDEVSPVPSARDIPLREEVNPMRFSTAWSEDDFDSQMNVDSANNISAATTATAGASSGSNLASSSGGNATASVPPAAAAAHVDLHRSFSFGKSSRLSMELEPIPEQAVVNSSGRSPSVTKKGVELLRRSVDTAMLSQLKHASKQASASSSGSGPGRNSPDSCVVEDFVTVKGKAGRSSPLQKAASSEIPSGFKRAQKGVGKAAGKGYEAFANWLLGSDDVPLLKQPTQDRQQQESQQQQLQQKHGPVISYAIAPKEQRGQQQGEAGKEGVTWVARRSIDMAGKGALPHSGYWG